MIPVYKYQGCGNDFILIKYSEVKNLSFEELAISICDRHLGIGADGLIIVKENPLEMLIFNRDGTQAPMCGNGIRCFSKFCVDEGICTERKFDIKTKSGIKHIVQEVLHPFKVKVNMGTPSLQGDLLHTLNHKIIWDYPYDIDGTTYFITSIFIGTIHTMIFVDNINEVDIFAVGKAICNSELFLEKTNVNFIELIDDDHIKVRTYERGVGLTLACGTGCCASAYLAHIKGRCKHRVHVMLEKGTLDITIQQPNYIYMQGSATRIMQGFWQEG